MLWMMKRKRNGLFYSKKEETINSISHGIGIAMGVIVSTLFLIKCYQAQNLWAACGVWLYLFGMGGSYLASTLYHSLKHHNPWKRRLRHWDHAAIYWHIAGSYSPIMLVSLREAGYWGWGIFSFVWLCAFIGTTLCFCRLKEHSYLETICYIAMGCSIFVAFKPLCNHVPSLFIYWLIAEGVSYITGAVFYSFHKLPYMHSVFHLFVLGGTICHMIALWYIL